MLLLSAESFANWEKNPDHYTTHCQQWSTIFSNLGTISKAIEKTPKKQQRWLDTWLCISQATSFLKITRKEERKGRKLYISSTISKNNGFQTFPWGINSSLRDNLYCFVMYKAINSCWDWLIAKAKLRHVINLKSHLLWVYYKAIEICTTNHNRENTHTHTHRAKPVVFFSKSSQCCAAFFLSLQTAASSTKKGHWHHSKRCAQHTQGSNLPFSHPIKFEASG